MENNHIVVTGWRLIRRGTDSGSDRATAEITEYYIIILYDSVSKFFDNFPVSKLMFDWDPIKSSTLKYG